MVMLNANKERTMKTDKNPLLSPLLRKTILTTALTLSIILSLTLASCGDSNGGSSGDVTLTVVNDYKNTITKVVIIGEKDIVFDKETDKVLPNSRKPYDFKSNKRNANILLYAEGLLYDYIEPGETFRSGIVPLSPDKPATITLNSDGTVKVN